MKVKFNNIDLKIFLIFLLSYFSILIGFYFNEDSLGGARNDFNYHFKISLSFAENFLKTFVDFGIVEDEINMKTRNSPLFWIILSQVIKLVSYDNLRIINSSVSILICLYFFKCLKLRFKQIDDFVLAIIACTIFLSPTIRSLSIWPYSQIWGLLFFVISVFHYLKFLYTIEDKEKFKQSFFTIFFIVISAYIHPAFGIFFLFYFINFLFVYNLNKKIFLLFISSLLFATPFLFYVNSKDIFEVFGTAQGISMDNFNTFNISNKIIIISAMIFFFIAPVLNFKLVKSELMNFKVVEIIFVLAFCLINMYFFNYPKYNSGFGGGFFYKLSNILFKNNYLFFIFSSFSIFYIYTILRNNLNNSLIFLTLIFFSPQLTIYHKYYDPLMMIIFMTLIKFDFNKHYFEKKFKALQLYFFYICYLIMSVFKSQVY